MVVVMWVIRRRRTGSSPGSPSYWVPIALHKPYTSMILFLLLLLDISLCIQDEGKRIKLYKR